MKPKTIILYDLKGKSNGERARIIQKLYGYRDRSNYNYSYQRKGLLDDFKFKKSQKITLQLKEKNDIAKISEILKALNVKFDVVEW